jgi:hypothetical protein
MQLIGVAQTGGGSGGSTAVSRVLMPSTVVDGGGGDLAVFAALVLCILLRRVPGFVLSFSFSSSFSSSPSDLEPVSIVTRSNALLLGPVRPCSLRGGFRGQSLHRSWPHVEQFDSLGWSGFWHSWQV